MWIDTFSRSIGFRYLFSGASGFSKLVNSISVVGLTLGISLLIVVSSVHNGLADERRDRLLRVIPHAFLPDPQLDQKLGEKLRAIEAVERVRREFRGLALIFGSEGTPVALDLIGIDLTSASEPYIDFFQGSLDSSNAGNQLAVSRNIARQQQLSLGDTVDLTFALPTETGLLTRSSSFELTGTFLMTSEVDALTVFVDIDAIRGSVLERTGTLGWNIEVDDPFQVAEYLAEIEGTTTWIDTHGEAFRAYQLERAAMYVLMTLVLLLAAFNIIASQAMLINVKRNDIAILATIGASRRQLMSAFAIQGGFITVLGIVLGVALGLLIAWNVNVIFDTVDELLGVSILEQSLFNQLPSRISPYDVFGAIGISLLLGGFALLRPLRLAFIENPVFVLNRAT